MSAPTLALGVTWLVYDFDGVMTDNRVLVDEDGREAVVCNRGDGLAVAMLRRLGVPQFVLTTEENPVVQRRAEKLRLPCAHSLSDKAAGLRALAEREGLDLRQAAYVGNDVNDLAAMQLCGLKVCPADAHPIIRGIADVITTARGGEGVVRELFDRLRAEPEGEIRS